MEILQIVIDMAISFFPNIGKDWVIDKKKEKEKDRQFKREKLEEIYMISKQMNDFLCASMEYKININCANPTKLQMNVHLYFIDELNDEMNNFLCDYQEAILQKSDCNFQQFNSNSFNVLIEKIIKITNDI